ncbi:MAG TPA: hypothetical protein VNZ54_01625, partial [bacterium]|nr:hypothetical protein [bacterium]
LAAERFAVLKRLCRAWPLNNTWPNETAWLAWKLVDKERCAWAFRQPASQRDAALWAEDDYAKARGWALDSH